MDIQNPMGLVLPESLFGGGLVLPYQEHAPSIAENVFIAPNASVIGQVTLGAGASIWFGSVLRGDIAPVAVGEGSNIQDNCVLHVGDNEPCLVGRNVIVGHGVVLHGCTIEDDCLIGMSAIVLNDVVVGKGSVVGAGALITQGMVIPPNSLVLGSPAKVRRELTEEERRHHALFGPKYVRIAENYRPSFKKEA